MYIIRYKNEKYCTMDQCSSEVRVVNELKVNALSFVSAKSTLKTAYTAVLPTAGKGGDIGTVNNEEITNCKNSVQISSHWCNT